ncbi:calcium release-activated calcium channel protein 1-like isoform X3 [Varroa jacobsoni]|uniref:Calcium release-activated calcium channel protein 1 n=1 Tax=Varroa destructor TaxID=109461 RepID=A0A7M7KJ14_VARDE|nr:calcium release-activated calcium channel protein 1-like isoform X2 [Varroa destructor]XP_022708672.1 calcium release-activated calcium channel protein 1-like isoform X3 [Varroa jacobsoni]
MAETALYQIASQLPAICRDITPNIYPPSNYSVIHCACPSCCGTNAQPLFSSTYNSAPITRSGSSAYSSSLHSSRNVLQASYHPYPMAYESPYHSSSTSCSSHSPFFAVREMSKPENNVAALNWRRLHLSRAKLKASSRTSALLSGFAMVAMVEINLPPGIPEPLLIAFCVCTTLLVSVHMLALMISTCILPNLEAVASIHGIVAVNESPHEKMHLYIEAAWGFSTVFGILLFMAEIAIICWVVFIKVSIKAALAGTIILIPVVMLFTAFALHFYRNLVAHKFERSAQTVQELEDMVNQLQSGTQHSLGGGSQVLHV